MEANIENLAARVNRESDATELNHEELFNLQSISNPDATGLQRLVDTSSAIRGSLLSLASPNDVMNAIMTNLLLSKVDAETRLSYDEKQSFEKLPDWDEYCKFLTHRCQFLEGQSRAIIKGRAIDTQQRQKTNHMHLSKSFITTNASCTYCDPGSHYITQCKSVSALQLMQRKDFVKKAMLCFNCLRKSHVITDCSSKSRCKVCQGAHHTLLHAYSPSPIKADSMTNQPQQSLVPEHADSNQHSRPRVSLIARTAKRGIIPTALVQIKDGHGDFQIVRALLDSGSEVNLITEETAKRLQLEKSRVSQSISGVSNTTQTVNYNVYTVIKSRVSEFKWCSHFAVIKRICNHQPSEPIDISQWDIPNG
ncbi:uncharacterized protein [Drosophila takahashii]|uniref:uncharacterized protein n=1 Tax=Drosophila takahashii TaxID=29030 RepID=UPI0038992DB7